MNWQDIPGWFQWRSGQEEAAQSFPPGSRFVEVGNYLGRSLCSLGEVVAASGKRFTVIGIDTCRGSGVEGPRQLDYHGDAVREGGGTFAGTLHKNVIACGYNGLISLIVADSLAASALFADGSIEWVHLDARHDRDHLKADIEAWLPKVKPGGWLSGDDYDELKWPEVVATVKELLPAAQPWSTNQWRWTNVMEASDRATSPSFSSVSSFAGARRAGQTVVCTLGMHRSGTSAVSRMLNLLGVDIGSDAQLMAPADDNPSGFWEHRAIVEINDRILETFDGRWDRLPTFPSGWPRSPELAALRNRAEQLLLDEFSSAALWGWKDPRTAVTLPFWQDLVGPMRYVVPMRNPKAVVASLVHRNGIPAYDAEWLWLSYVQAIVTATSGCPRLFVFYEDLIDDPSAEMHRMAAFLGVPERAGEPAVRAALGGFIKQDLCHHRSTMGQLAREFATSFSSKSLYLAIRSFGCNDISASPRPRHAESADEALNLIAVLSVDAWHERERQWTDKRHQALREAELRETSARIESALAAAALERDAHAHRAADASVERDAHARRATAASQLLSEIHSSLAWRLVTDSRLRLERAMPQGTRRRRVFSAGLQRLTSHGDRSA